VGWHKRVQPRRPASGGCDARRSGWRASLEALAPEEERHLLSFEGHVTHLTERDVNLLEHVDVEGRTSNVLMMKVGGAAFIRDDSPGSATPATGK